MKKIVAQGEKINKAEIVAESKSSTCAGAEYASDENDEKHYQSFLQQTQVKALRELAAIKFKKTTQSIKRLVPVEAMLKDIAARHITEVPKIAKKDSGISSGYITLTQLREVGVRKKYDSSMRVRDEVLQVPDRLKMDERHMVKLARPSLLSVTNPDPSMLFALQSTYNGVREYIAGPLYNILLPGASPKIGIIHNTHSDTVSPDGSRHLPAGARKTPDGTVRFADGAVRMQSGEVRDSRGDVVYTPVASMSISSKFMPEFKTLNDDTVLECIRSPAIVQGRFPTPISGFEKVVAASIMMGEIDPNPGNIGFIKEVRSDASRPDAAPIEEFRAVKIDHDCSFICNPQNIMKLLHHLEAIFFSPADFKEREYTPYIDARILTFDLKKFKEEIDLACNKLNEEELKNIIGARIDALEKAGVNFTALLTLHKNRLFPPAYSRSSVSSLKEPTKQGLRDYYVNNIMRNKELMRELSAIIGEVLERENTTHLKPREALNRLILTAPEMEMVSAVAHLVATDLFQSGAKGRRSEDAERIKEHLIGAFAELKKDGCNINLSAEQMGELVGQHRSAFNSKWARRVDSSQGLAQRYYDASTITPADRLNFPLHDDIKHHIKTFIESEASKGSGRS